MWVSRETGLTENKVRHVLLKPIIRVKALHEFSGWLCFVKVGGADGKGTH